MTLGELGAQIDVLQNEYGPDAEIRIENPFYQEDMMIPKEVDFIHKEGMVIIFVDHKSAGIRKCRY